MQVEISQNVLYIVSAYFNYEILAGATEFVHVSEIIPMEEFMV